jgi:hypothetical protein
MVPNRWQCSSTLGIARRKEIRSSGGVSLIAESDFDQAPNSHGDCQPYFDWFDPGNARIAVPVAGERAAWRMRENAQSDGG